MALCIFTYLTYMMLMVTAEVSFLWDMQSCAKMFWNAPYQYSSTNIDISWCIWLCDKEYVSSTYLLHGIWNN